MTDHDSNQFSLTCQEIRVCYLFIYRFSVVFCCINQLMSMKVNDFSSTVSIRAVVLNIMDTYTDRGSCHLIRILLLDVSLQRAYETHD